MRYLLLLMIVFCSNCAAIPADVSVCFTPGQRCDKLIINEIDNAKRMLLIQAYQFTSVDISRAVLDAKVRGVEVVVILDKTQASLKKYSPAKFLSNNKVMVWIDSKPAIAHNKVMIIDEKLVITGSYNFSKNAQKRNAENLVIINSTDIAKLYTGNFNKRLLDSRVFH